jgi:cytochrome c biogenesis protein CcmG/thiol:disulfide interchange protein DsbE
MRRALVPAVIVVAIAALIALLAYGVAKQGDDSSIDASLAKGRHPAAPTNRALPLLRGRGTRRLADYRGRVVVLNVWASWCEPCKTETPLLERLQRQISARGGTVVGVTYKDLTGDAEAFVRRYGLTYPVLRDVSGDFAQAFGVTGVPETFVLDRTGRIVAARRFQVDQRWIDGNVLPLLGARA